MKKLNATLFALCAILLNAATTNALEWPWNKYKWQASTTQSWKEYGTQKGKAILLGIKNHRKTTGAVLFGIGGLALAYKYQEKLRSLWANKPPQSNQEESGPMVKSDLQSESNPVSGPEQISQSSPQSNQDLQSDKNEIVNNLQEYNSLTQRDHDELTIEELERKYFLKSELLNTYRHYPIIVSNRDLTPIEIKTLFLLEEWRLKELQSAQEIFLEPQERNELEVLTIRLKARRQIIQ